MVKQMEQKQDHNGFEADDYEIQGLEMKGGLASNIDYPAKYMHAGHDKMPTNYARSENMRIPGNAMRMTMRAKR